MKNLINVILKMLVVGVAAWLFPNQVYVDGFVGALVFALLTFVVMWVILILQFVLCLIASVKDSEKGLLLTNVIMVCDYVLMMPLSLYIISSKYDGFAITGGFWTYAFLSLALILFCWRKPKKDSKKKSIADAFKIREVGSKRDYDYDVRRPKMFQ